MALISIKLKSVSKLLVLNILIGSFAHTIWGKKETIIILNGRLYFTIIFSQIHYISLNVPHTHIDYFKILIFEKIKTNKSGTAKKLIIRAIQICLTLNSPDLYLKSYRYSTLDKVFFYSFCNFCYILSRGK